MRFVFVLFLMLTAVTQATAQDCPADDGKTHRLWLLERRGYYDPFLAEPHAPAVHLLFYSRADTVKFRENGRWQNLWDMSLGIDAPIVGRDGTKWSWGFWVPISFHMIENMGDHSNPILNTDYRFGGSVKVQRRLASSAPRSIILRWVPFMHESSHLGDEFSLRAQRLEQGSFKRINVSYEFFDVAVGLESTRSADRLRATAGMTDPIDKGKGFYNPDILETNGAQVHRTRRHQEWYFTAERLGTACRVCMDLSVDARRRIVFDYDRVTDDVPEDHKLSYNLILGFHPSANDKRRPVILYVRGYYGVNPNGQFRDQRRFRQVGIGLHFPM